MPRRSRRSNARTRTIVGVCGRRLAEQRDALAGAPQLAAGVVAQLLQELAVPLGVDQSLEDVVDDVLLFLRVEAAADDRLGDLPVVGNVGAQQAALTLPGRPASTTFQR